MPEESKKWYLHADLDAFFASVEQLDNPDLRGKPVIVGGKPEDRRSVVSTASYEARKFGVHSAMPVYQAYKLCPQGIFIHGRMQRYAELSYQIMNIFRDYSPDVDQMSIDEAFIDLSGTEKLFGPPEETALKIKERVKKETGLTISLGLATTKYLAKISSGLSKPDGFYHLKAGCEKDFMLNLPLNKVWGLGPKSQELIRKKGFNSTRDIYERDYDTLEFLFGKNMATFLYNVVRGIEKESFSRETKSHSISAENTFPYDLTDIYTIETELLELAHGVFFRLLKEGAFSRTAFVKIRYDDFSTSTVQETRDRNIMTLDTYFEIIKSLFEKRYENGRGIRLLGVGFDNITKEDKPYQQDLFSDNKEEKRQAVEQAILKLSKKHPEIKVRKARTLKGLFIIALFGLFSKKAWAENPQNPEKLPYKEPPSLFEYDINDENHVDMEVSGYWKADFLTSFDSSFGKDSEPAFSFSMPVFKQEVELYSKILLNNHWFFQADFADAFKKNTFAAGYQSENLVRYAILSNRGISMKEGYSAENFGYGLKGGNNQAPGFALSLMPSSEKWQADFLLRYDMTETKSKTFYGMNSLSENKIKPADFLYGREFHFPQEAANLLYEIKEIYVEASGGKYKGKDGKNYKKLSTGEYTFVYSKNLLYFSEAAGTDKKSDGSIPEILITFTNESSVTALINCLGSYQEENSFLGKIQKKLGKERFNLADFSYKLESSIEGESALKIQSSKGFSPFLSMQNYSIKQAKESEIEVIYTDSGKSLKEFSASSVSEKYTSLNEDFFSKGNSSFQIFLDNDLENNYPFAELCPEIYLNLESSIPISILSKTYSTESDFNIGKDAAENTVLVYKNGRQIESNYDRNTGKVSLKETISDSDVIVISWQEDTSDFSQGALAAGAAFKYFFTPGLQTDISATLFWPFYSGNNFATTESRKNAFAAISAGLNYERENFKITESAAFALQTSDTSKGLYVIKYEDSNQKTYYHEASASKNTEKDSEISGYKIPITVSPDKEISYADIRLTAGSLLSNCDLLEMAFKAEIPDEIIQSQTDLSSLYEVYLLLGTKYSDENLSDERLLEDLNEYPVWKLDENTGFNITQKGWQKISIKLKDKDRSLLTSSHDARLLIVKTKSEELFQDSWTLCAGPYEPLIKSMYTTSPYDIDVNSTSIVTSDSNLEKNYISRLQWEGGSGDISGITYFTAADFSAYKSLSWSFLCKSQSDISFTFELENEDGTALSLYLYDFSLLKDLPQNQLHTLNIDLEKKKLFIDDIEITEDCYDLYINKNIIPNRMKLCLHQNGGEGSFYCGSLIYEDAELYSNLQNYTKAEYSKEGNILEIKSFPLLKDFYLSAESLQSSGNLENPDYTISSKAQAKALISAVKSETYFSLKNFEITNAGHSFTTDEKLIPYFSAKEKFDSDILSKSLRKENSLSFTNKSEKNPLKIEFTSLAQKASESKQNSNFIFDYNFKNKKGNIETGLKTEVQLNQKTSEAFSASDSENNYFSNWKKISGLAFSTGLAEANHRKENLSNILSASFTKGKLSFKPEISYSLEGDYSNSESSLFTDKTGLSLLLPVSFTNHALSFEISRNGGNIESISERNTFTDQASYVSDSKKVLLLQKERDWFYQEVPFAELFQDKLTETIDGMYSAKYQLRYKRRISNSIKDLFIPSAADLAFTRDIKTYDTNTTDLYQIKASVSNTSLNNFGSSSINKCFNWFIQEEIFSNLTSIFKFPRDIESLEDLRFQISLYNQLLLFIKDKTYFTSAINFIIENGPDWNFQNTLSYERPCKENLIYALIYYFYPSIKNYPATITRKDSLTLEFGKEEDIYSSKYNYTHSTDLKINNYFTVNAGSGLLYTRKSKSADLLSIQLMLGIKAEF